MANERLKQLRALMAQHGMDAYYIPSSDFHDSEYVDPYLSLIHICKMIEEQECNLFI